MTDATTGADGPTAGLRQAIDRLLRVERIIGGIDFDEVGQDEHERYRWQAAEAEGRAAQQAIDAALAALDVRLARLVRFVRADQAVAAASPDQWSAAMEERWAAQAALTEEDVAL